MTKRGVFCIEGEWNSNLRDRGSVQPLVEFLAAADSQLPPIFRRAATEDELMYFIKKWRQYKRYTIGYFPFHGEKGALKLGRKTVALDDFGAWLEGACKGRDILISSCRTFDISQSAIAEFRRRTQARSVAGYRKSPDWIESAALDVMVMTNLSYFDSPSRTYQWVRKYCGKLADRYGFIMDFRRRG